jgi:hypothetical protein
MPRDFGVNVRYGNDVGYYTYIIRRIMVSCFGQDLC